MRNALLHISLLLTIVMSLLSCGRTPHGVMSVNEMADLIVDLQIAEAYIDSHIGEYTSDSSKLVLKQSVFKKHGITQEDYDSSLVWYSHNMEDYIKAHDKAIGKLKERYDKLDKNGKMVDREMAIRERRETPEAIPQSIHSSRGKQLGRPNTDSKGDTIDLWQGNRSYVLTQGAKRGFITFSVQPDAQYKPGDRYGWVAIDVQSDSTRRVRRIYGYVSYDIKRGQTAIVDSLMLLRSHMSKSNYGFINAQRLLERKD